jgi:hypothetical protein
MTCPVLKLVIDFGGIKHISWVGDSAGRVHDNAGPDLWLHPEEALLQRRLEG